MIKRKLGGGSKMNDEIKEMMEQMESIAITGKDKSGIKVDGYGLQQNELKMLLDYITNLREELKDRNLECHQWFILSRQYKEENERLKAQVTLLEDNRLFLNKKIDQAIKSLKQECIFLEEWHYDGYDPQLEIIIDLLEANS